MYAFSSFSSGLLFCVVLYRRLIQEYALLSEEDAPLRSFHLGLCQRTRLISDYSGGAAIPTNSQSQSKYPQEKQQLQLVCTWSVHIPLSGLSPSPFPRSSCPSATVRLTTAGELFLSGGHTHGTIRNGLYVISTGDFSTTLLKTSGQVPNPRYGHRPTLTSTVLLIWGGITSGQVMQNHDHGDSFWLLNLGTLNLLISIPVLADQRLPSRIARVGPHQGQWSRARRSLLP